MEIDRTSRFANLWTVKCTSCGGRLAGTMTFCPFCGVPGHRLAAKIHDTTMKFTPLIRSASILLALASHSFAADEFSFDTLRADARAMAAKPYVAPKDDLADFWKNLSYDEHRIIQFKEKSALWAPEKLPFSVDFFHPGWTAKRTVAISEVADGTAKIVPFDRKNFAYHKLVVPPNTPEPSGYVGWRGRTHINTAKYLDEFVVFMGASYFRTIPRGLSYGLSARGLSINSGLPGVPEEFPDFSQFYLQHPSKDDNTLTAFAILNGESVAGAYQFKITPGDETVMDIEAEITLRRPVQQLGIAPFSSMFWFGEGTNPKPTDFRPEVHDSDGLLMELGSGNLHYRPLETTKDQFRHCVFHLEKPRSWALLQRDRSFSSYQDPEAAYHNRPSVRVEPLEGFDDGNLHLIEMPTVDETNDNVILIWEPQPMLEVGKAHRFHYRLRWMKDPAPSGLFAVRATRAGTPVQKPNQILMTIDFAKPLQPIPKVGDPKWDDVSEIKPFVTVNREAVKVLHVGMADLSMVNVDDLPANLGHSPQVHMPQVLRAFIVLDPPAGTSDIDMTCELRDAQDKAVSERWVYLWKKLN